MMMWWQTHICNILIVSNKHMFVVHITFRMGLLWLFIITLSISAISDILVDTIDGFAYKYGISEVFTSLVILPYFSNIAEQGMLHIIQCCIFISAFVIFPLLNDVYLYIYIFHSKRCDICLPKWNGSLHRNHGRKRSSNCSLRSTGQRIDWMGHGSFHVFVL